MKVKQKVSRKKAVCGYCSEQMTFEDLLEKAEIMEHYATMVIFRWRCSRGHLSYTAVTVDNRLN